MAWLVLHFANHHVALGRSSVTWGNAASDTPWERNLTDAWTGHTSNCMAGVFTDNFQPGLYGFLHTETVPGVNSWNPRFSRKIFGPAQKKRNRFRRNPNVGNQMDGKAKNRRLL